MLALVRLLVEVHDLAINVQLGYLTILFQMNQRYQDTRHDLASLHPCDILSALGDNHHQFQSDVGGPVPLGSGFAHPPTCGECLNRVLSVGPELVQAQDFLAGGPEIVQAPAVVRRPSVSLRPQLARRGCSVD